MLLQHTSTMNLNTVRDGRRAWKELVNSQRYGTLTPTAYVRLAARIQSAFDELDELVDESPDPTRAHLGVIVGGRRG